MSHSFDLPDAPGSSAAAAGRKIWRTGTLVYTGGGLALLFFWLLWGDFGYYLKERAMIPAIVILLGRYAASDFLIGLISNSVPQAISIMLVPVIGYRSDRFRSRWGRRIPFLAFSMPIAVVAMVGLAFSPTLGGVADRLLGARSPGYNACVIVWLALFWLLFEFSSVICSCLFHGLIADVVPREVIGRFYAMFRMVSTMAGMAYTYTLQGKVADYYCPIFLGIAAVFGVSFTFMLLKVKEGAYPPLPPRAAGPQPLAITRYVRECFSRAYYVWIFLAIALGWMATTPISIYVYKYAPAVGLDLGRLGKFQTVQLFLSVLQAYPLGWLADRFHPLRVTMVALALLLLTMLGAFFFVHNASSLGIAVVLVGTMAGSWSTASLALAPALFPKERFATFQSAMTLSLSFGMMVIVPACGWMLDQMNHDYIYIYYWGALMIAAALLATYAVYRRFLEQGGTKNYVAP